ncbi:MAG: hypothetical protein JST04_02880 [Bdellovibrionales bacterium]|nr:hypothetical protein [Bdellovibrionales bacterium]
MKSRQKKKNAHPEVAHQTGSEMIGRSLSHLNRSLRQFSDGLRTRFWSLQERLLVEPLESAAWGISQRVRKVQNRVFDLIDERISMIDEARHKKMDHQTALERFDAEGGSMQATSTSETIYVEEGVEPIPTRTDKKPPRFAFEPSFQH